jgi:hypothetical protein
MTQQDDQKIFRSFEEFERDELRRLEAIGSSVDAYLDDLFTVDLDLRGLSGDDDEAQDQEQAQADAETP